MKQRALFNLRVDGTSGRETWTARHGRARARNTDPATSQEAAQKVEDRGIAHTQRALCLAYMRKHPGQTSAEIAAGLGVDRHMPGRRLSELRDEADVVMGEERICTKTGSRCVTWFPRRSEG